VILIILRWLTVAFLTFAVATVAGIRFVNAYFPKVYTASSEIQVSLSIDPSSTEQENLRETHVERIKSRALLSVVLQDLKLETAWERWALRNKDTKTEEAGLDHLRKMLKIASIPDTNLIRVSAQSRDPQEAADIANKVADKYKQQCDEEVMRYFTRQTQKKFQSSYWLEAKTGLSTVPSLSYDHWTTWKSTSKPLTAGDDIVSENPLKIVTRAEAPATEGFLPKPLYTGLIIVAGLF